VAAISTDSEYLHHAWAQQVCSTGGLRPNLSIPLLADCNMHVVHKYGCLIEDKGITLLGKQTVLRLTVTKLESGLLMS